MDFALVTHIGRDLLLQSLLLVAPVVLVSLFFGLLISVLQTITGIQEQTLSFAPRIVAAAATIIALLPWYLNRLQAFTIGMFQMISQASQ
jgi:flagellar biosynthetic protein FliQ